MATSSTHKGWLNDRTNARLAAVYNGTEVFDFDANDLAITAATSFAGALDINSAINVSGEAEFAGNVHLQSTVEAGADGVGADGEQFTSGGAGAGCDWAAAGSLRQFKKILGIREDAKEVLEKVVSTPIYDFQYLGKDEYDGDLDHPITTGDRETVYTGIMADEAPELMHHHGRILNPINTTGYLMLAIKGLYEELTATKQELAQLKAGA